MDVRRAITNLLLLLAQTVQNLSLNPPGSALSLLAIDLSLLARTALSVCTCAIFVGPDKAGRVELAGIKEDGGGTRVSAVQHVRPSTVERSHPVSRDLKALATASDKG